jgi:hypothetical protein
MSEIPDVRITHNAVYIGEDKLPGLILERGVAIEAGGSTHANILVVRFIVGEVVVDDPTLYQGAR